MLQEWLTVREAAEFLGISEAHFYRKLRGKEFQPVGLRAVPARQRVSRARLYFRREEIEAAIPDLARGRLFLSDGRAPSVEDCIYLAGLFDGEGSVTIHRRPTPSTVHYYLTITVANTFEPVMSWVRDTFGGNLHRDERLAPCRPIYKWVASCVAAHRTLQRIGPFLRIKHDQAQAAIEFSDRVVSYGGSRHHRPTPEELAWREEKHLLVKSLNKRGIP